MFDVRSSQARTDQAGVTPRARWHERPALAILGFVLVALNMRAAISAVSPLLDEVSRTDGLTSAAAGLVTTLPVLAMSLGASFAPRLARRLGMENAVFAALLLLIAAVLLRVLPSAAALFAGCLLTGAAITVLNVLMPSIVKRDFPERGALMTGVYSTVMIGGATVAAALSVPLEHALGSWQASLGFWAVLAAISAIGWFPQVLRFRGEQARLGGRHDGDSADVGAGSTTGEPNDPATRPTPSLLGNGLAWQISVFMGVSSLLVYTVVTWLPTILTDHGMDSSTAGVVFAFNNLVQVVSAFLVPLAAGRMSSQRSLVTLLVLLNAGGFVGLILDPVSGAWLWAVLLGLAQGGSFGLALTMLVLRAGNAGVAARLSGMAQTIGYLIAALGPVGAGALRQLTGGWTLPLAILLATCGLALVAGLGAGRDTHLRLPRRAHETAHPSSG